MARAVYPTEGQVQRALKAAEEAGLTVTGYEVARDGRIVVRCAKDSPVGPLDIWLREQNR